jgi:hypothetical protein
MEPAKKPTRLRIAPTAMSFVACDVTQAPYHTPEKIVDSTAGLESGPFNAHSGRGLAQQIVSEMLSLIAG